MLAQSFSENVADSPIKNDKKDIKFNLINNNAITSINNNKKTERLAEN